MLQDGRSTTKVRNTTELRRWWPELTASTVAMAGLLFSVLLGFDPLAWPASASDMKTLYAAALLFRQHLDPYNFHNVAAVFAANQVVSPPSWYGHASVYPPFTLAAIAPLTYLPMVAAMYVWIGLSAAALAAAALELTRVAGESFHLKWPWRMLLIALFAAQPLLGFGLEMCNVSIVVAALSILAVTDSSAARSRSAAILPSIALGVALLLKPHLAIWVVVALLVARSRTDRTLAFRSVGVAALSSIAVLVWMTAHHQLFPEIASYRAMVHSEVASGSMNATNYELLAVAAQITSAASLFGYWLRGLSLDIATTVTLAALAAGLIFASRTDRSGDESERLLRVCAWCTFGLLATYHRAHDAAVLLLLLPYLVARLRIRWRDPFAWSYVVLLGMMGGGTTWETMYWLSTLPGLYHLAHIVLYRQAPIAAMLLMLLLMARLLRQTMDNRVPAEPDTPMATA